MSKSLEKKKVTTTKNKKVVKEKSEKVEKVKENKIKKLTKKQLIIIGSIFAACILVAAISISLFFVNKETETEPKTEIKTCLVQFNTNGGVEVEEISLDCGSTIIEPEVPEKSGFNFIGWYINSEEYDFSSVVDSNIILEAKWEAKKGIKTVTVKFDTDGGSKQETIELEKGTYLVKPVDPTKKGYMFLGWYLSDKEFSFTSHTIDKNITLKAKWLKKQVITEQNSQSSSEDTNTSNDVQCSAFILSGAEDKSVFVGYHGHLSNIWGSAVVIWTEDQCSVKYSSSNSSVATIDSKGYVDIKTVGTTKFTGCVTDISTKTEIGCFSAKLEVKKNTLQEPTSIECFDVLGEVGEEKYLVKKWGGITDYFSVDKYFYITDTTSSNESIVQITNIKNSRFKLLKPGKVTLTLKTNTGLTGTCTVKVVEKKAKSVKIVGNYENVHVGDVIQLTADITPQNTTEKFIWTSDSKNVATVNEKGQLTALKEGTTLITIYNEDKTISDSMYLRVYGKAVKEVSLNKNDVKLNVGDTELLVANIYPNDAANKNVTWTSSDTSIATVSSSGKITAIGKGTTTITVKTIDGGYTDKCTVTVSFINVSSVSLNKTSLELTKGNTETLTAIFNPSNATDKNVTWSSSDTSVATVSSSGKVTAKGKGTATITVRTDDGGYTAKCVVTVSNPKLTVSGSIGIKTTVSSSGATRGVVAEINASGGTGTYTYYYIKLYKDGTLIGSTTNTSSNELFLVGHTNGSYTMEYEVRDSDGTIKKGTSSSTISGF